MSLTAKKLLDTGDENEIQLELLSYSGGEDTISEDYIMQVNSFRLNENWEAISLGGMERAKGFNLVASGPVDASTNIIDSETTPKTFTVSGDAQLDTAQYKFGLSSLLLDGTGDYVKSNDHADWQLGGGTGNFTIDMWVRFNSVAANRTLVSQFVDATHYWKLYWIQASNQLSFDYNNGGTTIACTKSWTPVTNTWYHVALIRGWGGNANDFALTVNGAILTSVATDADSIADFAAELHIGMTDTATDPMNGWIDEFRLSNTARWTTTFTVPTSAYTTDSNTKTLLHFQTTDQQSDLAHFHYNDSTSASRILGVIDGDLVYVNGSGLTQLTKGAFTTGVLCHATEGSNDAWITNATDNLKRYTIAGGLVTPSSVPATAYPRIYRHKNRLYAEGNAVRIYGSRVGTGNWTAADAWSLANDAFSIDLPNITKGCVPNFPSGDEIAVFTEFELYTIYNFPNVAFRPIPNSRGCSAPYSIALGEEGVYFLSRFPTRGIFVWDGTQFTDITRDIEDSFIDTIDFTRRIFATYRDRKYYIFYCESGSGVTYPNRMRVFNGKFGRWMTRPVNPDLSDNFGYPTILKKQNNELYCWSSQKANIYELETTDNSDEGNNTESELLTKVFTTRDFTSRGVAFPDEVRFKLLKATVTYYGTTGNFSLGYDMDRGRSTGSINFDLTATGDLINTTFIVNTSSVVSQSSIPDKTITKTFKNNAVGTRCQFQILHNGLSTRPKIKKIKILAEAISED